jgi:hypothetical protein
MLYQINLPDEIKDADGVLYEPTGEWRPAKKGEAVVNSYGNVDIASFDFSGSHIILRPKWQWPAWLKGWGFAMDKGGGIYFHVNKPRQTEFDWDSGDQIFCADDFPSIGIPVPSITDWTQPVVNPNWKQSRAGP